MQDLGSRTRTWIVLSAVAACIIVAAIGAILVRAADGVEASTANQRALLGAHLLVSVGSDMPDLVPGIIDRGLTPALRTELDGAVGRGQREDLLSNLRIWNTSVRVVYVADPITGDTVRRELGDVQQALRGSAVVSEDARALDPATHRRTGMLDAFEPLRTDSGRVFGVVEASLPMAPIRAAAAHLRRHVLISAIASGLLIWLLVLPVTMRAARALAVASDPVRRRTLRAFARGLARNEIELVYQPQVDPADGSLRAVEALVRWRRDGRLLAPDAFLETIERSPAIVELTDRVVELALAQLAAWRREGMQLRMAVNLSAKNLSDGELTRRLAAALARHDIRGELLTVEITETAILDDVPDARRVLEDITALGIDVSLDDFGTGYASISRLHQLPIREVKIDRSFANREDARTRAYLTAIVRFAQNLGLRTVVEGVEDASTLRFARALGCDLAQGYYISRPGPATAMSEWQPPLDCGPGALGLAVSRRSVAPAA